MYTARIIGKELSQGQLRVQVEFKSVTETFVEYFITSNAQPGNWIVQQVKMRLKDLNALPELHASIVTPGEDITHTPDEALDPTISPYEEYRADLNRFEKFVAAVAKGLTTHQHDEFVALKQKLSDNFKPEYLDLF